MPRADDPDRLSPDDAHILGLESAVVAGHTLKLNLLAPGPALSLDDLRESVAARLATQSRARQRVSTTGPAPRWVDAPDFDIRRHVRLRPIPAGCSHRDLWRVVSALMSEHLDRDHPLWTIDVIGPLADGSEAVAVRVHHAMADGIASVRFLDSVLWDTHGAAPPRPARSAPAGAESLDAVWRMPGAALRELGHLDWRSPFDRPITGSRELAFTVAPLADVRAIGTSRPRRATVNDVLLTVVAGGLSAWLAAGGAPREHLRAQVPVSLHHRDEGTALGNRDSFLNVDLPLREADPITRLDRIREETSERKRLGDAAELYDLFHALGRVPSLGDAAQRFAASAREFSVAISNVPGPAVPVFVAGRAVERLYSSSEPAPHHALRISAISCAGTIGIGLCTDPSAVPGVAGLADAVERAYLELRTAAGVDR